MAIAEAFSRVQEPSLAFVACHDKTYTVTPVAVGVQAGIVVGQITDVQVVLVGALDRSELLY